MADRLGTVLAGAIWLTASAALAQTTTAHTADAATSGNRATPATVGSVTVTAPRREIEKLAHGFVQAYSAPSPRLDQLARWRGPVCVLVLGLGRDQAAMTAARIEDVARAVGLKVGGAGCTPNIQVVFTDQPQELLDWVARRRDWILGYHYIPQTKTLKTVTRPIQAWYMTATRGGGGDTVAAGFASIVNTDNQVVGIGLPNTIKEIERVDDPRRGAPTGCAGHRFTSCLQSLFKNVLVVVDNGQVRDRSLGPITDYLAMVALSRPGTLEGCAALPSVIDLLAPAACPDRPAPDGLTPADAAYLTALYAADPEARKAAQQSEIAFRMAKILAKADVAADQAPELK